VSETENTVSPALEIPEDVAKNYEALVADENRTVTYKSIAKDAEALDDPALKAWAERRHKETKPRASTTSSKSESKPSDEPKTGDPVDYNKLLVPELQELIKAREIDASDLHLKADLVAALELDDTEKAKAAGSGE
jgi:hypothetical protein